MLIVDVNINGYKIDRVLIHRLEPLHGNPDRLYEYEIMNPHKPDERLIEKTVKCKYGDYKPLLIEVLKLLVKHEDKLNERARK